MRNGGVTCKFKVLSSFSVCPRGQWRLRKPTTAQTQTLAVSRWEQTRKTTLIKMNSSIQTIIDKLKKYPGVKYTNTDDSITVDPKDDKGFSVTLGVGPREFIVSADFWHEHFDKDEYIDTYEEYLEEIKNG